MPKKKPQETAMAGQLALGGEAVVHIPLTELHPYPDHPDSIREDAAMQDPADSIKANGVVVPPIVRPHAEGGYEIVAGHRRKICCERAGITEMPCIVRNLTDDEAIIQLVDSNAQREDVLPSERAKAYKMRLDAIKRSAGRPRKDAEKNSPNVSANFRSDDEVGSVDGVSGDILEELISVGSNIADGGNVFHVHLPLDAQFLRCVVVTVVLGFFLCGFYLRAVS